MPSITFYPEIPEGYCIYSSAEVAGANYRRDAVAKWFQCNNDKAGLWFEREPKNELDSNAIMVIGISDLPDQHIGYIPREIAKGLVESKTDGYVRARLRRIWVGDNSRTFYISFDVIGPKIHKREFRAAMGFKDAPPKTGRKLAKPKAKKKSACAHCGREMDDSEAVFESVDKRIVCAECEELTAGASALDQYRRHIEVSMANGDMDAEEMAIAKRLSGSIPPEVSRAAHARVYANMLIEAANDGSVSDDDVQSLETMRVFLTELGWCP